MKKKTAAVNQRGVGKKGVYREPMGGEKRTVFFLPTCCAHEHKRSQTGCTIRSKVQNDGGTDLKRMPVNSEGGMIGLQRILRARLG